MQSGSTFCTGFVVFVALPMGLACGAEPPTPSQPNSSSTITEKQRQFWAFQPVKPVSIPAVGDTAWPQSAIDRFILSRLEAKGLRPVDSADKRVLLRRASFDLIGLPPTPAEIDAFLADDSPQAFARVVDRLLASPRYGERWGRHWLDVVRYADVRDLIQLPPASDFRESWRYRDWVVDSFNRDLPYSDFIRQQIAGDLLPPPTPGGINKDGLIATGLLAIADFVPGDVDKDLMIADYVNDEIDVVGRAFLGLTLACARCHDHKFDPISTEDYYALAGIFFSTRLIPGPVAGNTPLIRVPLASPAELAQHAADKRRRAELELYLRDAPDREYLAAMKRLVHEQTDRYFVAACQFRNQASDPARPALSELATKYQLHENVLAAWAAYLGRVEKQRPGIYPSFLQDAAAGRLTAAELDRAAKEIQQTFVALAAKRNAEPAEKRALARAALLRFRADDPQLVTDAAGRVTVWPNGASQPADAKPPAAVLGPLKASATINGHTKTVLRFDGHSLLEAPSRAPPSGSLLVVYQNADKGNAGQRLVGWEDSDVGKNGFGLMPAPDGRLHAVLRNNGQSGDIVNSSKPAGFEIVSVTWGPSGATLHRNSAAAGTQKGITGISSDPAICSLNIGGPGSGGAPRFRGDVAELRVYDRPLSEAERQVVEAELRDSWFKPSSPESVAPRDRLADLYDEFLSPRGPFWVSADERMKLLAPEIRSQMAVLSQELELLKKKPALTSMRRSRC